MVPIGGFLSVKDRTGPVMIQRYNLYQSLSVNATPAPGVSSGEAIAAMERAATNLPPTMRAEWTELALLQLQTKDTALRAFILSVVLVFLVLAAQYESWGLPLAVILVVPMCLLERRGRSARRRAGDQHLHPGRLRRARRPRVQERDPDCRVREAEGRRSA